MTDNPDPDDTRQGAQAGRLAPDVAVSPSLPAVSTEDTAPTDRILVEQSLAVDEQLLAVDEHEGSVDVAVDHRASVSTREGSPASSEDALDEENLEEDFDMEYIYENGRRYANEFCLFPNDDTEEVRLNIAHQVRRLLLDGSHTISRLSNGVGRILDVGTGPGDWAIAMGEAFPNSRVIATDITLYSAVAAPSNVDFRIEDATLDWSFEEPFDFIHMRDMVAPVPDFLHIYRQVAKYLKRNGTFELVTGHPVQLRYNYEISALKEWTETLVSAMEVDGGKIWIDHKGKAVIEESGLRELKRVTKEISLGEWMSDPAERRIGRMALVASLEGIEAASLRAFTKHLKWPLHQARELIERAKSDILDPRNEPYCEMEWIIAKRLMI